MTASSVHPTSCHVGLRDRCCCGSSRWKFIFCSLSIIETFKLNFIRGIAGLVCEESSRGGKNKLWVGSWRNAVPWWAECRPRWCLIASISHKKTLAGYKHQDSSASCFCNMSAPTPQRRLANVGSLLLTPQENECLFNYLGRKCIVSSAYCDFASSSVGSSVLWSFLIRLEVSPLSVPPAAWTCSIAGFVLMLS